MPPNQKYLIFTKSSIFTFYMNNLQFIDPLQKYGYCANLYLYLIIKYVRFPSSTNFFGPFCPPTKPHITTHATDKLKNLSFKVNLKFPVPVQNSRTSFNLASSLWVLLLHVTLCWRGGIATLLVSKATTSFGFAAALHTLWPAPYYPRVDQDGHVPRRFHAPADA
jgi:hypothetical protein